MRHRLQPPLMSLCWLAAATLFLVPTSGCADKCASDDISADTSIHFRTKYPADIHAEIQFNDHSPDQGGVLYGEGLPSKQGAAYGCPVYNYWDLITISLRTGDGHDLGTKRWENVSCKYGYLVEVEQDLSWDMRKDRGDIGECMDDKPIHGVPYPWLDPDNATR